MSEEKQTKLSGGKYLITTDNISAFCVKEGSALVFLTFNKSGEVGRRQYLGEIKSGQTIPSVHYKDDEGVIWQLIILAADISIIEKNIPTDYEEVCRVFANDIKLMNYERLGLYEALAEAYRIYLVKDNAFIYQSQKDEKKVYRESLDEIYKVFNRSSNSSSESTKNALYNCMAILCQRLHIQIAPLSTISAISANPSVEDIARISNFLVRKITLDDLWYKKDVGYFLAFDRNDGTPFVLIPHGTKKYWIVNANGEKLNVTANKANTLAETGYILYRPLPQKALNWMDVARYICSLLRPRDFIVYSLMMLFGTLIGLLLPELNRSLYDIYIPSENANGLLQIGLLLFSFSLGNILFSIVGGLSSFRFSSGPKYILEGAFYHRLFNLEQSILSSMESGELASRVMGLGSVMCALIDKFISVGIAFLMSFLYFIRMLSFSQYLSIVSLVLLIIYLGFSLLLSLRQLKYQQEELKTRTEINSDLYQYLGGIIKIRLSGATTNALLRHIQKYTKYKKINYEANMLGIISSACAGIIPTVNLIVLYWIVARLSIVSSGTFMAFNSAFGSFSGAVMSIAELAMTLLHIKPILRRAMFLISNLPESSGDKEMPGDLSGDIEISNVSFAYNANEGNVINGISLHIQAGEYIGIVGASGCGKSTLLKLLLGFESPNIGRIYYDGKDISNIDKRELRKKFGIVLQNGNLVTGSIQENISIVAPGISLERINEVIGAVGLSKDIEMMPMGIHTMLSEDSETISGGQKQRILIARALASDPSILMFDEATSALDNVTQNTVCATLSKLKITRIVIAHRLSTIISCDRIIVMDHGQVVEQGTYNQLMQNKGLFYNMAQRQIA